MPSPSKGTAQDEDNRLKKVKRNVLLFILAASIVHFCLPQLVVAAYIDNGNGTVTDTVTGLIWQQSNEQNGQGGRTWEQALTYCETLFLGNRNDWRLPNVSELTSIVDDRLDNPAIDPTFSCPPGDYYWWSSSSDLVDQGGAWSVGFNYGGVGWAPKSSYQYVRCVRGGLPTSLVVTISPQLVIEKGARWKVNDEDWQTSGSILQDLEVGVHSVEFMDISGWTTPASQVITIKDGQTTTANGVYINPDSDYDGMLDSWEMTHFGDLARDGTKDYEDDGLNDLGEYLNGTNPKVKDTDADGMQDGWEVQYQLNPKVDDASDDADGDGYSNLLEYEYGTNPKDINSKPHIVWYVDPDLSYSGEGTNWGTAFKTLQEAVDAAINSDEIWVKGGTYALSAPVEVNKAVAIYGGFAGTEDERSERNWSTHIAKLDGQGSVQCMALSSDSLIDGFVFTRCQANLGGALSSSAGRSSILNSRFVENSATDGGAIRAVDAELNLINCEFAKNTANSGGAIHGSNATINISNCTLSQNSASFGGGLSNDSAGTFTIVNSILWGDTPEEIDNVSGTVTATYSDLETAGGYPGEGNISDNPRFVDADNALLRLRSVSPCVDAGTAPGADVPDLDLAGNTRVSDGDNDTTAVIDMGAYEYQPSSQVNTTGVFRPSKGLIYLKKENSTGFADASLVYGVAGDIPIAGDWDGDGVDGIGIYRDGSFYLKNTIETGYADMVFAFGQDGDQPVAGDWDGDGIDTIGIFRNGVFMLRNSNSTGPPDMVFVLGTPEDTPIAGDWDGDGRDSCGVFRPSNGLIFLKNENTSGYADVAITFGIENDLPVMGDWDGDGVDTIGVYRNGAFLLRNSNQTGFAEMMFWLGQDRDVPISGRWGLP